MVRRLPQRCGTYHTVGASVSNRGLWDVLLSCQAVKLAVFFVVSVCFPWESLFLVFALVTVTELCQLLIVVALSVKSVSIVLPQSWRVTWRDFLFLVESSFVAPSRAAFREGVHVGSLFKTVV